MTQEVVKVGFKGPKSAVPLVTFDALAIEAQAIVEARRRIGKFMETEPHTLEDAAKCIAELEAQKPSDQHLAELALQLESGLLQATSEQIQEQLTLLLGAFPGSSTPDPHVYSRMMLTEVLATEPTRISLVATCSELRRTLRWPPSIPEVLLAIREQELRWRHRLWCAKTLGQDYAEALSKLLERRSWLAKPPGEKKAEREERLARLEKLKKILNAGSDYRLHR
jgi:hypothetical protein